MNQRGFSLIELLIVLGIIGIMLAFAIPNYSAHLAQERRLAAETAIMKLAGYMETFYAQHHTYEGASFSTLGLSEGVVDSNYRLEIKNATASQFKLAAIPQGKQANLDARCGSLLLNSEGKKQISGYGALDECW